MSAVQRMRLASACLFLAAVCGLATGQDTAAPHSRPVMATRLYTGADGQSHLDQVPIPLSISADFGGAQSSEPLKMSESFLVRGAPGMFETWHNAGHKRYIVVISGEAEVKTTGGESARLVPGHIYLAEDLTGKGHTFRVVGDQEWLALFVNFAQ